MFSLLKVPKPRAYCFKPRYYDEAKENRETREKRIKLELGIQDQGSGKYVSNIKGQMRSEFNFARKAQKKSNTRLIVILIILMALAYYLFYV